MITLKDFFAEGKAADAAHKLGYKYVGFATWADSSGKHVAKTKGDKLVPLQIKHAPKKFPKDNYNADSKIYADNNRAKNSALVRKGVLIRKYLKNGSIDDSNFTLQEKIYAIPELKKYVKDSGMFNESMVQFWNDSEFKKIGDSKGSNDGGFYTIGYQKYYIKFYKDPMQVMSEFIASSIYGSTVQIGHDRPKIIVTKQGKLAFANPIFENAVTLNKIKNSDDRRKICQEISNGFLIDVILANWDVIGLEEDNIMIKSAESGNPEVHRIDNGGALLFRAQGEKKQVRI